MPLNLIINYHIYLLHLYLPIIQDKSGDLSPVIFYCNKTSVSFLIRLCRHITHSRRPHTDGPMVPAPMKRGFIAEAQLHIHFSRVSTISPAFKILLK